MAAPPFVTGSIVTATELNTLWRAYWRKVTEKDVVSTAAETDLFNGEITIDAGAMATTRALIGFVTGDYLNNSGSGETVRFKLKLGSTVLIDSGVSGSGLAASATRRPFHFQFGIHNLNAANVQWAWLRGQIGAAAALTEGIGRWNVATTSDVLLLDATTNGTKAVDTTTAKLLELTVTNTTSSASISTRLKGAVVSVV